jgi:pimeloyl-ACP methyl ester carboxylesterase/streptogramin lyase
MNGHDRSPGTTLPDDEFELRLRRTLSTWADEAMIGDAEVPLRGTTLAPDGRPLPVHPDGGIDRRGRRRARRPHRNPALVAVAAAAVLAVVVGVVAARSDTDEAVTAGGRDEVLAMVPVGERGGVRAVEAGAGAVFVSSENDGEIYRVDPGTNTVTASAGIARAYDFVVTDGGVFAIVAPGRLGRLDPSTLEVDASVAVPDGAAGPRLVGDLLWVVAGDEVLRFTLDLDDAGRVPWVLGDEPYWLRAGGAGVWVTRRTGELVELDPADGRPLRTVDVGGELDAILVSDDHVWTADISSGAVIRIDPRDESTLAVPIGTYPQAMELVDGDLWVADHRRGVLTQVDPSTGEVGATVPVGYVLGGLVAADGSLWLGLNQQSSVVRLDPDRLPAAAVAPVLPDDHLVDLGGRELYLHCTGTSVPGRPTVLLEADAGAWSEEWIFVQYGLQDDFRACSYDRAGIERSDPGPGPRTASAIVADLHAALGLAAIDGPYVLVGQGFGGLYTRLFATTYPDEVAGMVLVHALPTSFAEAAAPLLSPAEREEMAEGLASGPEGAAYEATVAEVEASADLGDLPLVVLARDRAVGGWPDDAVEDLWQEQQAAMADLSTRGELVIATGAGFRLGLERPDLVVEAVNRVARPPG